MRIVNNRSLEDALAVVFGESPSFSAGSVTSTGGASVEQATQAPYESVGRTFKLHQQYKSINFVVFGTRRKRRKKRNLHVHLERNQ